MELHIGDTGTALRVAVTDENGDAVDLTSATTLEILLRRPDGELVTLTGTLESTNVIEYVTLSDTLDRAGSWSIQGHYVVPAGEWHTSWGSFTVARNLT